MTRLRRNMVAWLTLLTFAARAEWQYEVDWRDEKPHVTATLTAGNEQLPEGLSISVALYEAEGDERLWAGKLAAGEADAPRREAASRAVLGPLAIDKADDAKKAYRLEIGADWPKEQHDKLFLGRPERAAHAYGLRQVGRFPETRVFMSVQMAGSNKPDLKPAVLSFVLRDRDDNEVLSAENKLPVEQTTVHHRLELTPPADAGIGPYGLEFSLEHERLHLFLTNRLRFAHANFAIPVTGFEVENHLWLTGDGDDPLRLQSMRYYYSNHLRSLVPSDYPAISFDSATVHSGEGALRIAYTEHRTATVWSRETLPGNPTMLSFWVKGYGARPADSERQPDLLYISFQDNINHTFAAWQRNAHFRHIEVGPLDFDGWRQFRVPVLGDGLAVPGLKGSTEEIDAPIGILAFQVQAQRQRAPKEPEGRQIWIDDLVVETQAEAAETLRLRLQSNNQAGRLKAATELTAVVANGSGLELPRGRLTLAARDRDGQVVYTTQTPLAVAADGYARHRFELSELAAKGALAPVDVDVTFAARALAGLRTTERITFKQARHEGMFLDFEVPEAYSGYRPGEVVEADYVEVVEVDGNRALAVTGIPMGEREIPEEDRGRNGPTHKPNGIVLHPALPGLVSRLELRVKGGEQPVTLQPLLLDSGYTGIWNLNYNIFWPEPIQVDWQGWRTVSIEAPPVPAHYGEKEQYFFREPWYPLNLAFALTNKTKTASTILLDDVRVRTHLPAAEALDIQVVYPNETRLHPPGGALRLRVTNFAPTEQTFSGRFTLRSYQGLVAAEGDINLPLKAGERQRPALVDKLPRGVYTLTVKGSRGDQEVALEATILALAAGNWFTDTPETYLTELSNLRRTLGLTTEKIYLDWDNFEPVPGFIHHQWFDNTREEKAAGGAYTLAPVLGFSADWAGPEAHEAILDESYLRSFPNYLQVPVRTLDWSRFIRECLREYHDDFDTWLFWENPDLDDAPQGIPPARYRELLAEVERWVRRYDASGGKVVAGGFNFSKVLGYLEQVPEAHTLPFDEIAVQMNLGELAPEQAEMEAFLDELGSLLKLPETGRRVRTTELDWGIGDFVSPLQQAAYHVRAAMILDSRGAREHEFTIMNTGYAFDGYGVVYRNSYGNTDVVQTFKPYHVPKPAYFALRQTRAFLADWRFVDSIDLPAKRLGDFRAFVYGTRKGRSTGSAHTVALWSTTGESRTYRLPEGWREATVRDAFGLPLNWDRETVRVGELPVFLEVPKALELADIVFALRHLPATDGSWPVALNLHVADSEAAKRAGWQATGDLAEVVHGGRVPGGRRLQETFATGIEQERFTFELAGAGNALLYRRWYYDGEGGTLSVSLNGGPAIAWDLTRGQEDLPGIRESTLLLRGCRAGANTIGVEHGSRGNVAAWRVEPLAGNRVPLARWAPLHARQSRGDLARYESAVGTPLSIGSERFASGYGTHAISLIELPLAGQFTGFEVTVGIDGHTEGRGSVAFRVFADGEEVASSGLVNGFSKPLTLGADRLAGCQRLLLAVTDGGDGEQHDLANWVEGWLIAE